MYLPDHPKDRDDHRRRHPGAQALRLRGLPPCPGAYALYDHRDNLLYSGRAKDLKDTVQRHFNPSEDNPLLKVQVRKVVLYPTRTVTEAKAQEGRLFDLYLAAAGRYPPANRNRPSEANIADDEIVRIRLRKAFGRPSQ